MLMEMKGEQCAEEISMRMRISNEIKIKLQDPETKDISLREESSWFLGWHTQVIKKCLIKV